MKIILAAKSVYPFHPFGGVQKYVYYYAKALARKGIDLEIVAPLDQGKPRTEIFDGLKYTFLRPSIYRYLEYPVGWLGVHLFSWSLARYLKNKDFDVLHAFDLTGYQYLRNEKHKPTIAHIFSDNYLSNPISVKNSLNFTGSKFDQIKQEKIKLSPFSSAAMKRQYLMQYLLKVRPLHFCLERAESIFYEADVFKNEVNALYRLDSKKSALVPVGVDVSVVDKMTRSIKISRDDLKLKDDDIVLITVNRLAADKGVDKILLALGGIVKQIPQVKFIMIGSGYQEKELYSIMREKGLKDYVRHVKDVPEEELYQYYAMSDIYISAFSYPGSSISTLEAMTCSLPVITTGQPWLVRGNENGVVLEDNNPDTIERVIVDFIKEGKVKQKGMVSREVVQDFDWNNITQKAILEYEKMLG